MDLGGALRQGLNVGLQTVTGGMVGLGDYGPQAGVTPGLVKYGLNGEPASTGGVDASGRPLAPGYNSLLKGDAYNNLRDTINNKGMNPWSAMALSRQNKLGQKNIEEATDRVAGQNATTMSKLAAGGGLTSGARERTAQSGQSDLLKMVQDINNKKDTNSLQIGISDGDFKQKALAQLGGLEQAENQGLNAYNQNAYNEQMRAFGAEKQAQATAASGGGGTSFICTALREDGLMTKSETAIMFQLLMKTMFKKADFINWYVKIAPQFIKLAREQNFDFSTIKKEFVDDIIKVIREKGHAEASALYAQRTNELISKFITKTGYKKRFEKLNTFSFIFIPAILTHKLARQWVYTQIKCKIKNKFKLLLQEVI